MNEFDLYNANGLIKPLEKLINFDTLALKKYNMQLYVKRNLFLSDITAVKDMAEGGKKADNW